MMLQDHLSFCFCLLVVALVFVNGIHAEIVHDNDDEYQISSSSSSSSTSSVTLIGMGKMGMAIAKCLMNHGYAVHAWNRSPKKILEHEQQQQPHLLTMHSTPYEAMSASNVTIFVINSAPHLQTVVDILSSRNDDNKILDAMKGKVVVNMVNHEPFAAKHLETTLLKEAEIHHVSALLFGVPETVCSEGAHLLVSAPARTASTTTNSSSQPLYSKDVLPSLEKLGQVHEFLRGDDDVGLASVVYLCLVQSLYFGLAGYELSLLILWKYMAHHENDQTRIMMQDSNSNAIDKEILERFQTLASKLLSKYLPAFLPIISNTIIHQEWSNSYVPASAVVDMFEMHAVVFERLGLMRDSYHAVYLKYLRETVKAASLSNNQKGEQVGVSAVVQHYSTDGYEFTQPKMAAKENIESQRNDNEL